MTIDKRENVKENENENGKTGGIESTSPMWKNIWLGYSHNTIPVDIRLYRSCLEQNCFTNYLWNLCNYVNRKYEKIGWRERM